MTTTAPRIFCLYDAAGSQRHPLATFTTPTEGRAAAASRPDGEYTVRDVIGGLRFRFRVSNGVVTILETTR